MTKLYSYVVARDYGFAPNPFYGSCTLATCKWRIRNYASVGDWIIGTGSSRKQREGYLVYVMRVSAKLTFNEYWAGSDFKQKRPNLRGSKKQSFGDNIYFRDPAGKWHQEDSHHSYADGSCNYANLCDDTKADAVLVGVNYAYWGSAGPQLPSKFRGLCAKRGYKCKFPEATVKEFVSWFQELGATGYLGDPGDWD